MFNYSGMYILYLNSEIIINYKKLLIIDEYVLMKFEMLSLECLIILLIFIQAGEQECSLQNRVAARSGRQLLHFFKS